MHVYRSMLNHLASLSFSGAYVSLYAKSFCIFKLF
jgi:hypothetical protein